MAKSLEIVTLASVRVTSGNMLIAHADSVDGFDLTDTLGRFIDQYLEDEQPIMKKEFDCFDRVLDLTESWIDSIEQESPESKSISARLVEAREEHEKARSEFAEYRERMQLRPPKLLQGENYILIPIKPFEGYFSIVHDGKGYKLLFDARIMRVNGGPDMSNPNLWSDHGNWSGFLDGKTPYLVVADATSIMPTSNFCEQKYAWLRAYGEHSCKFDNNPDSLVIWNSEASQKPGNSKQ